MTMSRETDTQRVPDPWGTAVPESSWRDRRRGCRGRRDQPRWVSAGGDHRGAHQLIGGARAAEVLLTGRVFSASEAQEWGFVADVVPPGELLQRTLDVAERIASLPADAVRETKAA